MADDAHSISAPPVAPLPPTAADLTGKTFGRLRVLHYLGRPPGFRRSAWWCLCDPVLGGCGKCLPVLTNSLTTGNTRSCGCFRSDRQNRRVPSDPGHRNHPHYERTEERHKGAGFIDITDQKFGMLTVVSRAENRVIGKVVHTMWNCVCDCGTPCVRSGTLLRAGGVVSCGCMRHKGVGVRSQRFRDRDNAYMKRRKADPRFLLESRVRARMRSALRRVSTQKTRRLSEILGYSYADLEARLRVTIPEGMTWDDFVAGRLDIDHIVELWRFDYTSEDDPEFRKAWALDNLQLLTKQAHAAKSAAAERDRAGAKRLERRPARLRTKK
jgi:hypothetical protein